MDGHMYTCYRYRRINNYIFFFVSLFFFPLDIGTPSIPTILVLQFELPGRPSNIGLQLDKACYPSSR